jgi:DNA-binding MarR family transcriptional regulator
MSGPAHYRANEFTLRTNVGYLIKRCTVLIDRLADVTFESQSRPFLYWLVLAVLREHSPRSAGELSNEVAHDMGALSRVVDELVVDGLVHRERSPADRRRLDISATPDGVRIAEETLPFVLDELNRILQPFTADEVDTLVALLDKLLVAMESAGATPQLHHDGPPARRRRETTRQASRTSSAQR